MSRVDSICTCPSQAAGRDVRPAADLLSFASPKESRQRKGDPAVCVPALFGLRDFDRLRTLREPLAGMCPRQGSHFLLRRQKKVTKEKATLLSASLRFATGNLRCALFAGSAQTRLSPQTARGPDPRKAVLLGAYRRASKSGTTRTRRGASLCESGLSFSFGSGFRFGFGRQPKDDERSETLIRSPIPTTPLYAPSSAAGRGLARSMSEPKASLRVAPVRRAAQVARSNAAGRRQRGRPFFGYFLSATRKKVTAPPGAHPGQQSQQSSKPFSPENLNSRAQPAIQNIAIEKTRSGNPSPDRQPK